MIAPEHAVDGARQRASVGAPPGSEPRPGWGGRTLAAAALVACAAWALWPLSSAPLPRLAPVHDDRAATSDPGLEPLDLAAFRAPLWVVEPPPPEPPPPPPPPPPLKLQLLAIVREAGTLRAAIYDPESDALRVVGEGERIGACTIESIGEGSVRLAEHERTHTLRLERPGQGDQR